MTWQNPQLLWLLLALPLIALCSFLTSRAYAKRAIKENFFSERQSLSLPFLGLCVLAFLVIAAAGPKIVTEKEKTERTGLDIALCVDLSDSMLAEDISPNRLERAKREVSDILDLAQGDRFSLIAYSGVPFLEVPLTLDYSAIRLFTNNLTNELIPVKGSNLAGALLKAQASLGEPAPNKAIVLLSDGEHFEGNLEDLKVPVFILGIGTKEGSAIPNKYGYKRDESGGIITTKLDENALKKISRGTGGKYQQSRSSITDTKLLFAHLNQKLNKDSLGDFQRTTSKHLYQIPLGLALLILVFSQIKTLGLMVGLLFLCSTVALNVKADEPTLERANRAFQQFEFSKADELYKKLNLEALSQSVHVISQAAASAYRSGDFLRAAELYGKALEKSEGLAETERADLLHNLAGSEVQTRNLDSAIANYQRSLELDPLDENTKANLAFAKKLKQEESQKNQKKEGENSKDSDSDNSNQENQDASKQKSSDKEEDSKSKEPQKDKENSKPGDSEPKNNQEDNQNSELKPGEKKSENPKPKSSDLKDSDSPEEAAEPKQMESPGSKDTKAKPSENQQKKSSSEEASQDTKPNDREDTEKDSNKKKGELGSKTKESAKPLNQAPSPQQNKQEVPQNRIQTILDSLEEDRTRGSHYRSRRALKRMKRFGITPPKRDW